MYLQNKYTQWYYSIIYRAKSRTLDDSVYVEKHHIIPRSLGGGNSKDNIAILTAREHFICHLLLPKFTSGLDQIKMIHAAWCMINRRSSSKNQRHYKITSTIYEMLKIQKRNYLKTLTGPLSPIFGKKTGRTASTFTSEWKSNISAAKKGQKTWNKGIKRTPEEKAKMSATRKIRAADPNWNKRPSCSPEKAQKIKEANLGKR